MAEDARRLLDHLGIARADVMGYSMGARITAFLALEASRSRAQRHLRRPRRQHGASDGRHGPDRARAGGGEHRRRHQSDRAHLPRLRREDRQRSQGAGGLHPRRARAAHAERVATLTLPGAGGHRQRGRDRRHGRGAGRIDPGRRGAYRYRGAITCAPSAIASTRKACWRFCGGGLDQDEEYGRNH